MICDTSVPMIPKNEINGEYSNNNDIDVMNDTIASILGFPIPW
nr:hypothetical protein [Providencia rettgeri]